MKENRWRWCSRWMLLRFNLLPRPRTATSIYWRKIVSITNLTSTYTRPLASSMAWWSRIISLVKRIMMKNSKARKPTLSTEKLQSLTPSMPKIKAKRRRLYHEWKWSRKRRRVRKREMLATTSSHQFQIRINRMKSNLGNLEGDKHRKLTCPISLTLRIEKRTKLLITAVLLMFLPLLFYHKIAIVKKILSIKNLMTSRKQWICQPEVHQLWIIQNMHYALIKTVA